jgi:hypothetical protein
MAGDWIKMRTALQSHPKVVRILSALNADICPQRVRLASDKFRVIGGLHAVWAVFDAHSVDGTLHGYTPDALDHVIGWPGFAAAMIAVDWLSFDGAETLALPEFDEHNGQSGKRRAEDQKRKRNDRRRPQSVRNLSGDDADEMRTREEKRREEKKKQKKSAPPSAAEDDPVTLMIDAAVEYMTGTGVGEKQARSLIGMLRKHRGDVDAAKSLAQLQAEKIADPAAWIARVAKPRPQTAGTPWEGAL